MKIIRISSCAFCPHFTSKRIKTNSLFDKQYVSLCGLTGSQLDPKMDYALDCPLEDYKDAKNDE